MKTRLTQLTRLIKQKSQHFSNIHEYFKICVISQNLTVLRFLKGNLNPEIIQTTFTDSYAVKLDINNNKVASQFIHLNISKYTSK